MKLRNDVYDVLKWVALIVLPAVAVLYTTLSETWGLPYGLQISVTINAIALFIGTLLGLSTIAYNRTLVAYTPDA